MPLSRGVATCPLSTVSLGTDSVPKRGVQSGPMTREEAFDRIEQCARYILYWSEHAESEAQRLDFLAGAVNGINAAADVLLPDTEDELPRPPSPA